MSLVSVEGLVVVGCVGEEGGVLCTVYCRAGLTGCAQYSDVGRHLVPACLASWHTTIFRIIHTRSPSSAPLRQFNKVCFADRRMIFSGED